jgi:hypothetical protein
MSVNQLTRRNPDGTCLGYDANDLFAFYGATPAIQRSGATQTKVSTTALVAVNTTAAVAINATSTGAYGFSDATTAAQTLAAVNGLITQSAANMVLVNELRASLVAMGLIAGA